MARIREAYPSLALEVRNQRGMESLDQFEPLFASDRMLIVPRGHLRNPSLAMRS